MKKIFLTIIAVLMVFSSTSINVSAVQEQTVSEDVKIELIQNNQYKKSIEYDGKSY